MFRGGLRGAPSDRLRDVPLLPLEPLPPTPRGRERLLPPTLFEGVFEEFAPYLEKDMADFCFETEPKEVRDEADVDGAEGGFGFDLAKRDIVFGGENPEDDADDEADDVEEDDELLAVRLQMRALKI